MKTRVDRFLFRALDIRDLAIGNMLAAGGKSRLCGRTAGPFGKLRAGSRLAVLARNVKFVWNGRMQQSHAGSAAFSFRGVRAILSVREHVSEDLGGDAERFFAGCFVHVSVGYIADLVDRGRAGQDSALLQLGEQR